MDYWFKHCFRLLGDLAGGTTIEGQNSLSLTSCCLLAAAAGPGGAAAKRLQAAADEAAASKQFAKKAAAYGGFLIVLYFTFAAVYCLVNMPFKQDTLLYGRSKAD